MPLQALQQIFAQCRNRMPSRKFESKRSLPMPFAQRLEAPGSQPGESLPNSLPFSCDRGLGSMTQFLLGLTIHSRKRGRIKRTRTPGVDTLLSTSLHFVRRTRVFCAEVLTSSIYWPAAASRSNSVNAVGNKCAVRLKSQL